VIWAAGFLPSAHDPALFIHLSPHERTLLLVYANDIFITGDDVEHISHVKKQFGGQFQMSDLGPSLSYFLGIEVSHFANGYYPSQSKYIQDLIVRSGIIDNRPVAIPMDMHLQLMLLMEQFLRMLLTIGILWAALFILLLLNLTLLMLFTF
jgi:hypothetical protein